MKLLVVQSLLALSPIISPFGTCHKDENYNPVGMQRPMAINCGIDHSKSEPKVPREPRRNGYSMTPDHLVADVKKDFVDPLNTTVYVRQILDGIEGTLNWWGKSAPLSWVFNVDVRIPVIASCYPTVSDVVLLWEGLDCTTSGGCEQTITTTLTQSYQTTEGLKIDAGFSLGASGKGLSASVFSSVSKSWQKTWGNSSGVGTQYTFHLENGERCTPAMAHLELECEADFDTVHYDSYYRRPKDWTNLEERPQFIRHDGPFDYGQWCFKQMVTDEPLVIAEDWHEVLPDDGFSGSRGKIWHRPAEEMNQYRTDNNHIFQSGDIIIRRYGAGIAEEVFGCLRDPKTQTHQKINVPVSSEYGAFQGYVGCIQNVASEL